MIDMDKRDLKVLDILSGRISIAVIENMTDSKKNQEQAGNECNEETMNALKDAYMLGRASTQDGINNKLMVVKRVRKFFEDFKSPRVPQHLIYQAMSRIDLIKDDYEKTGFYETH